MPLMRPLCHKIVPASCRLGNTRNIHPDASDIWYSTNSRGRLTRVNLTSSSNEDYSEHTYDLLPLCGSQAATDDFAMSEWPVQGPQITSAMFTEQWSSVQQRGYGNDLKRSGGLLLVVSDSRPAHTNPNPRRRIWGWFHGAALGNGVTPERMYLVCPFCPFP